MDWTTLVSFQSVITLLGVFAIALIGKWAIDARRKRTDQPKSTLAKDAPSGGVPADT